MLVARQDAHGRICVHHQPSADGGAEGGRGLGRRTGEGPARLSRATGNDGVPQCAQHSPDSGAVAGAPLATHDGRRAAAEWAYHTLYVGELPRYSGKARSVCASEIR
jgi:hypothetical protein